MTCNTEIGNMEIGRAYGFFKCTTKADEIESLILKIRKTAEIPEGVNFYLFEDINRVKEDLPSMDPEMFSYLSEFDYVLKTEYVGVSNRKTADETLLILNQTYQSDLFTEGEDFYGEIVFEENGEYVLSE
ncbi:MAG: hypothetical protein ABIF08_01970 [Nanoarchaeota archaeon]